MPSAPASEAQGCLLQEFFKFCAFNLIFQLAGFVLFCVKARQFEDEWEDAFQRAVDVFIAAWPTSTPLVLIVALAVRMVMLKRIGIDTLQPAKLQLAAATEVVCFDKTGTLTANTVSTCSFPGLACNHNMV